MDRSVEMYIRTNYLALQQRQRAKKGTASVGGWNRKVLAKIVKQPGTAVRHEPRPRTERSAAVVVASGCTVDRFNIAIDLDGRLTAKEKLAGGR